MGATLARFEWVIVELIVMGLLIWQFVSIRRAVRRDREEAARQAQTTPPGGIGEP